MAVFREGFMIVDKLESRSKQIYGDAADFGVLTKKGDENWNMVKQLVDWYGEENTIQRHIYSTGKSCEAIVVLIDEWSVSDEVKTVSEATEKFHVSYATVSDKKGFDGLITISKM